MRSLTYFKIAFSQAYFIEMASANIAANRSFELKAEHFLGHRME